MTPSRSLRSRRILMINTTISSLMVLLVAVSVYGVVLMFKGWKLLAQSERDGIKEIFYTIGFLLSMLGIVLLGVSV
jgi:hypothetical protein